MTLKYESDLLFDLMKRDGDDTPSDVLPYESELKEKYLQQVEGAYPKLQDYRPEWLNYNLNVHIPAYFPVESVSNVTNATFENVVPDAYGSAILKGNTLVNLLNKLTVNGEVGQTTNWYATTYTTGTVKSGTYILLYHVKETSGTMSRNTPGIRLADGTYLYHGYEDFNTTTGIKKWIFTANEDLSEFGYWLTYNTGKVVVEDFILLEYQEGMENWDIPYFEGMQSVKMPVLTTSNEDGTKTNILTVNEDVTLRSKGGVYDELNLLNGRLTQRIDENNEVLAQEVVKTVDLTVTDQDGNTKSIIRPIEGTMHLMTDGDTIKPLFSGEIPVEATTQNLMSFANILGEE